MSEASTGVVLPFVALAEHPHRSGVVGCGLCGYLWAAVWPALTPVRLLECPRCKVQGQTIPDPPRAAAPVLRDWSVQELADLAARGPEPVRPPAVST